MGLTVRFQNFRYVCKSDKYVYVSKYKRPDNIFIYRCTYKSKRISKCYFFSEKEAAIEVDLRLIRDNKEPINVLKSCEK